jgi:hypothetical protein
VEATADRVHAQDMHDRANLSWAGPRAKSALDLIFQSLIGIFE